MRRPRLKNWARRELLESLGLSSFNLRKIAALVQGDNHELAPLLMLYAYEAACLDRLHALIYDKELKEEFDQVNRLFGNRDVERLALRGTPMMTLPEAYRNVLSAYAIAYRKPEAIELEKRTLQESAHEAMLRQGVSPADLARELNLDPGNLHAFLTGGDTHRFTLETIRSIESHLTSQL